MKLIIAGATGLVGSEIVRQALQSSDITQVIALARRPVQSDENDSRDSSKLKTVVVRDYADYPDHVKAELAGANTCIWSALLCAWFRKKYQSQC